MKSEVEHQEFVRWPYSSLRSREGDLAGSGPMPNLWPITLMRLFDAANRD